MSMAQRTLAKDIDLFYEEDSPMKVEASAFRLSYLVGQARAQEYVTVGEEIAGAADRCMNDRYIMDVLEPVKKILDKIEEVRVCLFSVVVGCSLCRTALITVGRASWSLTTTATRYALQQNN